MRYSVVLLLTAWGVQLPAMAEVMLCPREGVRIEISSSFFDPARVRLQEIDSGQVVVLLDGYGKRGPHVWQAPAGTQICYTIQVELTAAPGRKAFCLTNDKAIGYAVDAKAPLSVLIRYRNARLEKHGHCGVLPAEREASASPQTSASPPPLQKKTRSTAASGDVPPAFAWPPPRPSTRRTLARHLVAGDADTPSLGRVADRLQAALEASGYTEYSYYSVPGGFALATRLERIYADGRSMTEPKRWEMARTPLSRFELGEYLRALFDAEAGHFRVIVFIVTPTALVPGTEPPTAAAALDWPHQGASVLPEALRKLAYGSAFQTHALIYEFETRGQGQPAQFKANSTITGETHLRRAHILGALQP